MQHPGYPRSNKNLPPLPMLLYFEWDDLSSTIPWTDQLRSTTGSLESHQVWPSLQISQTSDLTSYFIYPRSNKNQTPSSMPVYSRSIYDPEVFDECSRPDIILSVIQQTRSCLIGISTNIPPSVFSPTKAHHFLSKPMSNSATELSNHFRKLFGLKQLSGGTTQPLQKVVRSRTTWWWNYLTTSESCSVSSLWLFGTSIQNGLTFFRTF